MESRTLDIIQKFAKVGKIVSQIIEILSAVGCAFCVIGIFSMVLIPMGSFRIGSLEIHSLIDLHNLDGVNIFGTTVHVDLIYVYLLIALLTCMTQLLLARLARGYFERELEAGTPFTFEGARELFRLGLLSIIFPIVVTVISQILVNIAAAMSEHIVAFDVNHEESLTLGLIFIAVAVICRYGAEKEEMKCLEEKV